MQRTPPTGRRAVIVGNGSSVDAIPPGFWGGAHSEPGCMLIGTNRALCLTSLQSVRLDVMVIRDRCGALWIEPRLGWEYHKHLWQSATCWKVGPAECRVTHCDEFVRQVAGWQYERTLDENREAAVLLNHSVVLMAANWAWLQGVRDIALVGVDYGPGPEGQLHAAMIPPWDDAPRRGQEVYRKTIPPYVILQFREVSEAVASAGGRIVNVSPGTRLKSVPQGDAMGWIGKE